MIRAILFFPLRLLIIWPLRLGWLVLRWAVLAAVVIGGWTALVMLLT